MKRIILIISAALFIIAMAIGFYSNVTSFSSAEPAAAVLSTIFDVVVIMFAAFSIVELIKQDDKRKGMVFFNLIFVAMEVSGLINYIFNTAIAISEIPPGYTLDQSAYLNIGYNIGLFIDIIPFFVVAAAVSGKVEKLRKIMMTIGLSAVFVVEFISYMNLLSTLNLPVIFSVMELFIMFALVLGVIGAWTLTYQKPSTIKNEPLSHF